MLWRREFLAPGLFTLVAGALFVSASPAAAQHVELRGGSIIGVPGDFHDPYDGIDPFWGHPYFYRGRGFARYQTFVAPQARRYYSPSYTSFYGVPPQPPEVPSNAALVTVRIPQNAELWFSGAKTSQSGDVRDFITPELKPDKNYFYMLRARWMEDGHSVERTRRIPVSPGARVTVDFFRQP
jgi:uncharacterized protein (TIGR03000 family)